MQNTYTWGIYVWNIEMLLWIALYGAEFEHESKEGMFTLHEDNFLKKYAMYVLIWANFPYVLLWAFLLRILLKRAKNLQIRIC